MSLWKKKFFQIKLEQQQESVNKRKKKKKKETDEMHYPSELFEPAPRTPAPVRHIDSHVDPHVQGKPLDYSFRKAEKLHQLEGGIPREYRIGIPKKNKSEKYITSSLWASYNNLTSVCEVDSLVQASLEKPERIYWLDLSFNQIQTIANDILLLTNLKILYLHGNNIQFLIEVGKLKPLKQLKTLTLHGNPIAEIPFYRFHIIKLLPQLKNLDFSLISNYERIPRKFL